MRILLVNPPNSGRSIPEERYGIDSIKQIFRGEPLALETLAGALDGHEVAIADLKADPDALVMLLDTWGWPDVVGFTGVTCEANAVLNLAESLKKRKTQGSGGPVVVVGGHHASCDPEFFNRPCIDYVVIGLGKKSFQELICALETNGCAGAIPGVATTRSSGPLVFRPRTFTAEDLVDDRAPRYDLVDQYREGYVMSGVGGKTGFVSTAFGCTHQCPFCSIPALTRRCYLPASADAVIRDMTLLKETDLIRFVDANTFGDIPRAKALAGKIIDLGLNQRIVADARADTVVDHPDLFDLWKQAGLASVVIGFEAADDGPLASLDKKSTMAQNIKAMAILNQIGIRIIGDFIVTPDYTHEDFDRLADFIGSHPIALAVPSILTPVPGTPLFRKLEREITIHDLDFYTFSNAVIRTRLDTETFYIRYSTLMKQAHSHITSKETEHGRLHQRPGVVSSE